MTRVHEHRWDRPWRGRRYCKTCRQVQYSVGPGERPGLYVWRDSMTLARFADKWLPTITGTKPIDMLSVRVAYPFEWNCYETWQVVFRVHFDFTTAFDGRRPELGTPIDVMNGWTSKYEEDFCRIDVEAEKYLSMCLGRPYEIGDNTYAEMRAIIQS